MVLFASEHATSRLRDIFAGSFATLAAVFGFIWMTDYVNRALNQRMSEAELIKETFLNRMSHELRTPLAAIVGLVDSCDSSDVVSSLSSIKDAATAGLHIVDEVLDWRFFFRDFCAILFKKKKKKKKKKKTLKPSSGP